jgi:hypothetical protein
MMQRRWRAIALPLAMVVAGALAEARPGGGHTSSGGGHSASGGYSSSGGYTSSGGYRSSSGSGGEISTLELELFVAMFVLMCLFLLIARQRSDRSWTSGVPTMEPVNAVDLEALRRRDPAFSSAVFEDFVFELYAAAHRGRGTRQLLALQPYLSPVALGQLGARGVAPQQVVIGTLRLERNWVQPPGREQIMVRIDATHIGAGAPVFVIEHWMLSRALGAKSRPPGRTRTWQCPNCGAPWVPSPTRNCAHCGQAVEVGRFDWCVEQIWIESETGALASLTGTVPEYGNELPTVVHPAALATLAQITRDDPQVTFETLRPRILLIYAQLNTTWNARDLTPVRGLVTASLRNYLDYWLREYARQGLRNTLADAQVVDLQLAKVTRDLYYDAITVRVFASGHDYTSDVGDRVVGGSTTEPRAYTEYWTFVRSSARRGPVTTTPTCPNCGAPLAISDIGDCTHCGVAVENGSVDWTLSKIEQDDNYSG